MTDIDIDAIRQREQAATPGPWTTGADETWSDVFPPWTLVINANHPLIELESGTQGVADAEFIAAARTDVPALLAKVDELTAELAKVREQLTAANRRADGLANDLRSAINGNTAYANENARLRSQLAELREQVFVQKPVVKAAEAWAEAWEELKGDDTLPYVIAQPSAALHDAIEQHRLMDMALTSARTENAEAIR